MIVDIPDGWLKRLLCCHPDASFKDMCKAYDKLSINFQNQFILRIGEYVICEIRKNVE